MDSLYASPLCKYELDRMERIKQNQLRLDSMGIKETARDLMGCLRPAPAQPREYKPRPKKARAQRRPDQVRRSRRLSGVTPEYAEARDDPETATWSDYEPGLDDLLADASDADDSSTDAGAKASRAELQQERQEAFQEARCGSLGRGAIYDSAVGITCHFCRQKKLCGEEGCPRCSKRSTTAECIGKTECSRCHGATGRFCRACLLIRYGEKLEDVRTKMADGEWLCPHCYEEEHPDEGWICNSSICMKRRGYKPTGIAIYDAQQRGFASVGHWLQAQLQRRGGCDAPCCGSGSDGAAAGSSGASNGSSSDGNGSTGAAGSDGRGGASAGALLRNDANAAANAAAGVSAAPGASGKENASNKGAGVGGKRGRRELASLKVAAVAIAAVVAAEANVDGGEGGPRRSRRQQN